MAPHLTKPELDLIITMYGQGKSSTDIHARIVRDRGRKGVQPPELQAITRAIMGRTHRRGAKEMRGRKPKWSPAHAHKVNNTRKRLYKEADGEEELHWADVIKKARVPKIHPSNALHHFKKAGIPVAARRPREKPMRDAKVKRERAKKSRKMAKKPYRFYTDDLDAIIDNKKFEIPSTVRGKKYKKMRAVRFHLRTPSEGIKQGFTKPSAKKNRVNLGGYVSVCAGIINNRIKIWHYLPTDRNWSAEVAEELYNGPIIAALRRNRGQKRKYRIIEDNDPTGYKSNLAIATKAELKIVPEDWPRYSPDLNPLDFFIWNEVEVRMSKTRAPTSETLEHYKARLRRCAMAIPARVIKKAVASIRDRAAAIAKENGGDIPRD